MGGIPSDLICAVSGPSVGHSNDLGVTVGSMLGCWRSEPKAGDGDHSACEGATPVLYS